jgi:uncharacterized protein (TIGR03118 family)
MKNTLALSAVAIGALCASSAIAEAGDYVQTDLVSNIPGLATLTDPQLVNPWGVSFIGPAPPAPFSSPFWISNNHSNNTTLYAVTGSTSVKKVDINPPSGFVGIPTTAAGPQGPTGQVSNTNSSSFAVGNGGDGKSAFFIFANLNGTISAWDGGASAFIQWTTPGAVYTGLAKNQAQTELYAANNSVGTIDAFNSSFNPDPAVTFTTPSAISALHLTPFNVQDIGGSVYVTYAPMGRANQIAATAGEGAVAIFSESGGTAEKTIIGGPLASPWGVALAPTTGFGPFSGDWLFGNFSFADPGVEVFNPATNSFVGFIPINPGLGHTAGGLWDLTFGTGGNNGSASTLYFTDGIDGERNGVFGAVTFIPEPSTWAMMALGFAGLAFAGWRARRRSVSIAA